jgi:hypothetical protein
VASSGSYNFSVTRDDIIEHAYEEIGVLEEGESLSADLTTRAAQKLNMMVKAWMTKGYHLWCVQDAVLFLVADQQSYSLGDASGDANWCAWDDYNQTETSAAAVSGALTVTLADASGFTTGDRIGVVQDDGTILWTTGTKSGSTITLASALTDDVASGNVVFSYTSRLVRPLRVIKDTIYRRDIDDNDTPITLIGKTEYDLLTGKTKSGKPVQVAYQPFLTSGRLWTWPCADLATDVIRFSAERPIQDFDLTTDNPDFPIEASMALYKNLAVLLAPGNGAAAELAWLKPEAKEALDDFLDWNRDNAPVKFMPDIRGR